MDDSKIIQLFWARNEDAIAETSLKYGSYCRSIAHNILGNNEDAEECVSDTFLQAWNSIPPHKPAILRTFLGKITRNLSFNKYNYLRADKRGNGELPVILDELSECIGDSSNIEKAIESKELSMAINNFVRSLPYRDGNIFIRRYFFNERIKEISVRYKITENNISVILNRTRAKLRKQLIKEGFIDER